MLLAGLQEVSHEDVATGRGALSLRSLVQATSAFLSIQLPGLGVRDIRIATAEANRMLVTKTLPHDVASLVFGP